MSNEFLNNIHQKITKKKKLYGIRNLTLLLVLTGLVSYQSAFMILDTRYEKIWVEYNENQTEYYVWDELNEIDESDALSYLIDEMDVYEIINEFSGTLREIELIKLDKLKG